MLGKEEIKELRQEFWGRLEGQMDKLRNPQGTKVAWLNYRTGIRDLYFRMEADSEGARICIDLQFKDKGVREIYFQQFEAFKVLLDEKLKGLQWNSDWEHWNGKQIARLFLEKVDCQLENKQDWDKMHLFLKLNFVKLDEFWNEFGEVFKTLK
jgi:Domain of unknown function (DUF4268)